MQGKTFFDKLKLPNNSIELPEIIVQNKPVTR